MRDDFYWFRVHDHIVEHPKIEPLSDGAFRLLVETWAYCRRNSNDGRISDAVWQKRGKPKPRRELAAAGLVVQRDGYVQVHDYLDWQQSAAEVEEARTKKSRGGGLGNHKRWHAGRGLVDPSCGFCVAPPDDPDRSQDRSDMRSQDRSQNGRTRIAEVEGERELTTHLRGDVTRADTRATPPPSQPPTYPDHCARHAHVPLPGPCGGCADQRKANAAAPPRRLTVVHDRRPCLVHAEPDVQHCRGCAADRKAVS
jgi:hypothetical protein